MTVRTKTRRKHKTGCYMFRVPTGRALSLRERILYARLLPLPSQASVQRLTREVGLLMDRKTVTDALVGLERYGLAERTRVGRRDQWRAVRQVPSSAKHLFKWGDDGNNLHWKMILPKDNPWTGKGSLERWVALAFSRHLARQGRRWEPAHIAKVVGLDARTLRVNLARLHAEGHLDGRTKVPLLGGRTKKSSPATLAADKRNVELENTIKQKAARLGYSGAELRKAAEDAALTHRAMLQKGRYKGGSHLKCLNARLDRELAARDTATNEVRRAKREQHDAGLRESVEQAARLEAFQKQDERELKVVNRIGGTLPLAARRKLPGRSELIERYGVEALERAADALESAGVSFQWNLSFEQIEAVIHRPPAAADLTPPSAKPAPTLVASVASDEGDLSYFEDTFSRPAPTVHHAVAGSTDIRQEAKVGAAAYPSLMDDPEFAAQFEACLAGPDGDELDEPPAG